MTDAILTRARLLMAAQTAGTIAGARDTQVGATFTGAFGAFNTSGLPRDDKALRSAFTQGFVGGILHPVVVDAFNVVQPRGTTLRPVWRDETGAVVASPRVYPGI